MTATPTAIAIVRKMRVSILLLRISVSTPAPALSGDCFISKAGDFTRENAWLSRGRFLGLRLWALEFLCFVLCALRFVVEARVDEMRQAAPNKPSTKHKIQRPKTKDPKPLNL